MAYHPNFQPTFDPPPSTSPCTDSQIVITNPATTATIGAVSATSAPEVRALVAHANAQFRKGPWRQADASERYAVLSRAANLLRGRLPELIALEVAQTGRPIREMRAQLGRVSEWFDYLYVPPFTSNPRTFIFSPKSI